MSEENIQWPNIVISHLMLESNGNVDNNQSMKKVAWRSEKKKKKERKKMKKMKK